MSSVPPSISSDARAWIESLRDRWRLQVVARRTRRDADGAVKEIPSRIRRFVEGIPWPHVKEAIDALVASAPYTGVIANGVDFGVAYRPTVTTWQRDAQSAALGAARPDATYTLVQDLVEAGEKDSYAVGSSSSCSEEVVADYVWDADSVEPLPEGGQGVTYSVAAVRRNEDGTFDYQLVKRAAKTQHVEPVTTRADDQTVVTTELWDNVYTGPDGAYVDETGAPLGIPAATVEEDLATGERTAVRIENVAENPDCTLRFQVVREKQNTMAGMRTMCSKTVYEHECSTTDSGVKPGDERLQDDDFPHVDAAKDGEIQTREVQRQPDGTSVITQKTVQELKKENSGLEYRRTTRAIIVTKKDRNVGKGVGSGSHGGGLLNANDAKAKLTKPGERREHEVTPGGLFNVQQTEVLATSPVPDSARNVFTAYEEVSDDVSFDTSIDDTKSLTDTYRVVAGKQASGRHYEVVQDMDEYGVVKKVVRTTEERKVANASVDYRRTPRATIKTKTDRNTTDSASAPTKVGGRESHEVTPGGLYNHTVTTVTPSSAPDSARSSATVFETASDDVTLRTAIDGAVATAGGGIYREIAQDMDEYGVVKKVVRTTTETAVSVSAKDVRVTPRAVITTTSARNQQAMLADPTGVGGRSVSEMTPGGRFNTASTVVKANPRVDSARQAATVFEKTTDQVALFVGSPSASASAGGGSYQEAFADLDDYGVVKKVVRTTKETSRSGAVREVTVHPEAVVTRTTNRNASGQLADPSSDAVGSVVVNTLTPGGSYDQVQVQVAARTGMTDTACENNHLVHVHSTTENKASQGSAEAQTVGTEDGKIHSVRWAQTQYGTWKQVKEDRTARPLTARHTWEDTIKTPSRTMTYNNVYICFRNYREGSLPDTGCDQQTYSFQRNEYGLLDGSVHGKTLVKDEDTSGGSGGAGEQGDKHGSVETYLYRTMWDKSSRKWKTERRKFTGHIRYLWSTRTNMLAEVARGQSRPDLGWVSAIHGWYAVIYSSISPSGDWESYG